MDTEAIVKKHVDKKLLQRIRILVIILVLISGALVYEVLISRISVFLVLVGLFLGVLIGFIAGRMYSIEWHPERSTVIGRLDIWGVVVLILYIGFSIARHWIFEHWLVGAILTAFTVSFVEGAMLGRILSMRFHIRRVLTEQGKI